MMVIMSKDVVEYYQGYRGDTGAGRKDTEGADSR